MALRKEFKNSCLLTADYSSRISRIGLRLTLRISGKELQPFHALTSSEGSSVVQINT